MFPFLTTKIRRETMKKYKQLTDSQRYYIEISLQEKSYEDIAKNIGFNKSTICREVKRNSIGGIYKSQTAGKLTRKRKKACKKRYVLVGRLERIVRWLIKCDWSPEQISDRLKLRRGIKVSHETIYKYIGEDKDLGGTLCEHLRIQKKRKFVYGSFKRHKQNRPSISTRPEHINNRENVGDHEIDTMVSKKSKDVLITIVDRKTRSTIILHSKDSKTENVFKKVISYCKKHQVIVNSITSDNGGEFTGFKRITRALGCEYYFCHPYSSYERGTNENTNGLIRQYFPKGCSFEGATQKELTRVQNKLNYRPRKCLGFKTPKEVNDEEMVVALAN
jgi:IS30 family transposase